MMEKQPLWVIAGPTASGKTALAVELARWAQGEVISADSMQMYREPYIGTARPPEQEQRGVPHHLLGCVPLSEPYSVVRYAAQAHAAIAEVAARGHQPILCGGTGLYIAAVTDDVTFWEENDDSSVRIQLQADWEKQGGDTLWNRLYTVDPETAARLHPHDRGRIVRALSVYLTTGRTMSEQQQLSRQTPSRYDTTWICLNFRDRAILYDRIHRRVDAMMATGLEEEARRLLALPTAPTALQAIGYKELQPYIEGLCTKEEAVERLKQATRRYAKRQLSWFRRIPQVQMLYVDEYATQEALVQAAQRLLIK